MSQNILSYTSRDYLSIKTDLVNAIPNLTDIWTSREDADPGMVLITLMAALGDNLSFNMDQQSFEFFGQTVTQRKNAARVLDLIGYKMHWYKSATLEVTIYNTNSLNDVNMIFNPTYNGNTQRIISSSNSGAASYFLLNPEETAANWNSTTTIKIPAGGSQTFQAVQGTLQSINFNSNSIDTNNRYYLPVSKIDQGHIWLADSEKYQWYLVDNLNELTETLPRFEFGVDEYSLPYIEFVPYWRHAFGEQHDFVLYYLVTRGASGSVATNILDTVVGLTNITANKGKLKRTDIMLAHGSNTVPNTKLTNQPGKDPQTAREAYLDSRKYIGTYNTLVTLMDYEKFMLRMNLISAVRAVDGQLASEYNSTLSETEAYNKVYPITYTGESYILYNGTSRIPLAKYTERTIYDAASQQALPLLGADTLNKSTWYKAYTTSSTDMEPINKRSAIISNGLAANNTGALQLVHNGSAGDLVIGLDKPLTRGTFTANWNIELELPNNLKLSDITCIFAEQYHESTALNLCSEYLDWNIKDNSDKTAKIYSTMVSSVDFACYGSSSYYIRLSVPSELSTPVKVTLDSFYLYSFDASSNAIDSLDGLGTFCSHMKPLEVFTTSLNGIPYLFDIDTETDTLRRFSFTNGDTWEYPAGTIVEIGGDTYLFQKELSTFAPYSLQLHMIAGDFLTKSAASSYTYAVESPVTVETIDNKPMGYISYQLHDNIVGTTDDSMVSQSELSKYKLFNTELSYGPIRKFPFFVDGQIHLKEPVSPAEANLVLGKVFVALQTYFNAYNLDLGEKISFNKIIAVINSADSHIDYFDAGANNSHGALITYPTASDYNPNKYNGSDYSYGTYDVNIDPKYFNMLSMQHYEDMLQANNSIVYWGDTLSGHLSIAPDSIEEKSTPLMTGISGALSYIVTDSGFHGVVTMTPDVANLYEFRTFSTVVLDADQNIIESPTTEALIKQSVNFQTPTSIDGLYTATISTKDRTVNPYSVLFQFTVKDNSFGVDIDTVCLCGYKKSGDTYTLSALNIAGQPDVNKYFTIATTDDDIVISANIPNSVSVNTPVFYLCQELLPADNTYFESDWFSEKVILNMDSYRDIETLRPASVQYKLLTDAEHFWGIYSQNIDLTALDINGNIYEKSTDGFIVGIRAKETLTSKASSIIVSNYAVAPIESEAN